MVKLQLFEVGELDVCGSLVFSNLVTNSLQMHKNDDCSIRVNDYSILN